MTLNSSYRSRKDLKDPDGRGDPWPYQENPWLTDVYNQCSSRSRIMDKTSDMGLVFIYE